MVAVVICSPALHPMAEGDPGLVASDRTLLSFEVAQGEQVVLEGTFCKPCRRHQQGLTGSLQQQGKEEADQNSTKGSENQTTVIRTEAHKELQNLHTKPKQGECLLK